MKILIAEDEQPISMIYKKLMARWDFDSDFVTNGEKAVERVVTDKEQYDICLMDIDMPVMDGFQATQLIRQKARYIPILAVTGNSSIKNKYAEYGMDDYLRKPFDFDELYNKINELTVKTEKIILKDSEIIVEKEMPMDKEELQELIELKKKGLTKLKLVGTETIFIVHKNIQNKISHDIVGEGKEMSEFIDRSENEPGRCHLYKVNLHVTKDIFTPDELKKAIQIEDEMAEKFTQAVDKKMQE